MFSRAAKSVVKSFGQRKYYAGEENLKITLIGSTEGINQGPLRLTKQSLQLNTVPIYDVANNKRFLFTQSRAHSYGDVEPLYRGNSRMLTMMGKSRSYETTPTGDSAMKKGNAISHLTDRRLGMNEPDTEQLVEALHRLPIGEEVGTMNRLIASTEILPAGDTRTDDLTRKMTHILDEMDPVRTAKMRVSQENNLISEIVESKAMYLASLRKGRERKPTKKTTREKRRVKKVPPLVATTPITEVTPFERSENRKIEICTSKCIKKNDDEAAGKWKNEGRLRLTSLENKAKDWTIPAAFANKKPRLLHDFSKVNDKPPSSLFFSHDGYSADDGSERLKRLIAISVKTKPRFYHIVKKNETCNTDLVKTNDGSTPDKSSPSLDSKSLPRVVAIDHASLPLEDFWNLSGVIIGDSSAKVEDLKCETQVEPVAEDVDKLYDKNERSSVFSEGDEIENDFCEKWRPVERVSSFVRSFLTNLRGRKVAEKSRSSLSFSSYHLEDLFGSHNFTRSSTAINSRAIDDATATNWQDTKLYASCNDGIKDPCTCLKESQERLANKGCKKDPCAKPDPCKKKPDPCKKKPDPCKKKPDPCAKPDPCKKKPDPCAKPDPCKKKPDPCAKPDPCKKKPDPCAKPDPCKKKPDPCKKKPDPCAKPDPCKKKPDPCAKPDPCKKKPDPCKKKPDPCAKPDPCKKKPDPCAKPDPCKKKPDPCAKPDPCKKKPDPCAKPDPCKKKPDPCARPDPCKKKKDPCARMCPTADFRPEPSISSCQIEKAERPPDCPADVETDPCQQRQCPPVFRAPGCPDHENRGGQNCKGNTVYHFKDEFLYKKLLKKKYLKFLFAEKPRAIGFNNANEFDVRQVKTNMELPKLYTLDTFGVYNFNVEN